MPGRHGSASLVSACYDPDAESSSTEGEIGLRKIFELYGQIRRFFYIYQPERA